MKVSELIQRLEALQAEHGDCPTYVVTKDGWVVEVTDTGHDVYDEGEPTAIEIVAEGAEL